MSAITQPRMNGREVVRCECGLIQFKSANGLCVKTPCRKPYLDPEPDEPVFVDNPNFPLNDGKISQYDGRIGTISGGGVPQHPASKQALSEPGRMVPYLIKVLRLANGWSQRDMARLMGCPRTYISKIERGTLPLTRMLERICYTFGISMEGFVYLCERAS